MLALLRKYTPKDKKYPLQFIELPQIVQTVQKDPS